MKKLIFILIILTAMPVYAQTLTGGAMTGGSMGSSPVAAAAITYVASSGANGTANSTSISVAFGASTTTGDLLIAMLSSGSTDPPIVGVGTFVDDRGNTWTRNITQGGPNLGSAIYSAVAKDVGTVTVTATTASSGPRHMVVMAFRGVTNNTPDTSASAFASSTNAHHGNLVTSAITVNVGFTRFLAGTASTVAPDANWTACWESETTGYVSSGCYRIITASGTYNDGWTYGTNSWWKAMGVAYK